MEENNQDMKSFKLSTWALKNTNSVFLILAIIVFGGYGVYMSLPKELFPEVSMPQVYVSTVYPGNTPVDMESLITRQLEKQIKSVDGLNNMKAVNVQDFSAIIAEFNGDVDIDEAVLDIKEAVDKAKKDLPNDLDQDPQVIKINASEFPIMNINLSGNYSIDRLKEYAEALEESIESLKEIDKVLVKGALEREVQILVDVPLMELNQLSFYDIENAIKNENLSISAGEVKLGGNRRTIRASGEFKTVDEIGNIIIKDEKQKWVYLRDIAEVVDGYKEEESFARLYGKSVVSLDIIKKSGKNLLIATEQITEILAEAKKNYLPSDIKVTLTNDQSEQVKDQLSGLENSIIMGVILVVLVLLFFLGVRNALFVGVAIPLSMLLSFLVLSFLGVTMNLVVLFALVLALGMLVDNGIVTVENIYRLYEKGATPFEAAKQGVGEIAVPIISSTATTLAAFFPLLFWNDLMGQFMRYIPLTLIVVLASSLFVALIINPVLAATFIKKEDPDKVVNKKRLFIQAGIFILLGILCYPVGSPFLGGSLLSIGLMMLISTFLFKPASRWFQEVLLVKLESIYLSILAFSLKGYRPVVFIFGTFVLLIASIAIFQIKEPPTEFFPQNEPKYVNVFVEMPMGTDILLMNDISKDIEAQLHKILKPYIEDSVVTAIIANVGDGTSDPNEGPQLGKTPHKARVTVSFVEFKYRKGHSSQEIMNLMGEKLKMPVGAEVVIKKDNSGPPVGNPINMELYGDDLDELVILAQGIKKGITEQSIAGIEQLKFDIDLGKPELVLDINRANARAYGLSTAQIGMHLRTSLFGKEVSKFKEGEEEYPIQLRAKEAFRGEVSSLMNQLITYRNPTNGRIVQIPISAVSDYKYSSSYGSVNRKDQKRMITIYSNVKEGYNANNINADIKRYMATYDLPEGYEYKFTGEQEKQEETMAFLSNALLIAVALITLILVSQFNSIVKPGIIVITVLFSLIGVFLGLSIFNMSLVIIMTGIGIVSLAGIVVNNAIVLIDYIDQLKNKLKIENNMTKKQHLSKELLLDAVKEAGRTRLRPVLLTAITTVLGLIPLATGFNIDFYGLLAHFEPNVYWGGDNALFWGPMAWTVIFGLTFATFLTLVIVPVMYVSFEGVRNRFSK